MAMSVGITMKSILRKVSHPIQFQDRENWPYFLIRAFSSSCVHDTFEEDSTRVSCDSGAFGSGNSLLEDEVEITSMVAR